MNGHDQARLQRWLDGLLAGDELRAFEEQLASDPHLQAECDAQLALHASLRRSFAPDAIPLPPLPAPDHGAPPFASARPTTSPRWPWFMLGMASSAAAFWCWALLTATTPTPSDRASAPSVAPVIAADLAARHAELIAAREALGRSWVALYAASDQRGTDQPWAGQSGAGQPSTGQSGAEPAAEPPMACVVGEQIPDFVRPLAPRQPTPFTWSDQPEVEFRRGLGTFGWEDRLRVLEFRALPSTRILVFVVRLDDDPRPVAPDCDAPRLELFRETRGPLVLYELTPFDRPRALPGLASDAGWVK